MYSDKRNGNRDDYINSFVTLQTYCVDKQVADSACTATAYLSGVKGNYGTIGVNAKVPRYQCDVDPANHVDSIAKWAQDAGKATGIVTTTRVTHASPAGNYASISERGWEHDRYIVSDGCDKSKVQDVAVQLVHGEVGKKFKVILGGGRYSFLNDTVRDEEGYLGNRLDGRNLIDEWKTERSKEGKAEYVWNTVGLKNLDVHDIDYLLGLFENTHCNYNLDIKNRKTKNDDPSLSEMVEVAIKILRKEEKGYYLFVEGGKIDLAHHDNLIRKSLDETEEFSFAIELARRMTNEDDTLIVVTADHAHTLTYNGYAPRGNDIMGIAAISESDSLPYTTMSYANGRGYSKTYSEDGKIRVDITGYDFSNPEYDYPATVPLDSETHGGDDVAVYASGPKSHLFIGTYEQTNIPILMSYAAEIGMFADDENGGKVGEDDDGAGAIISAPTYLLLLTSLSIIIRFF